MRKVVNDRFLLETITEAFALVRRGDFWLWLLGIGFIIGLTGPFGTYNAQPMPLRTAYWVFTVCTTFLIGYLVSFVVATGAERYGFGAFISLCIGSATASIPVTIWLAAIHKLLFETPFWADAIELFPYTAVVCIAVGISFEAAATRNAGPVHGPKKKTEPAWLDQLPNHLGRDLILLHSQDHYVRAETAIGHVLIRTLLQDAADDLGDYGVRIHRSWWVARNAIKAVRYRKGTPYVILQDDRAIPVGRTYRRPVKDALR